MDNVVIIDGDTILYLATYSKEKEKSIKDVLKDCDNIINDIFKATNASAYIGYLTDGSFRYKIAKQRPYKGNRVGIPKPKYFGIAKEYILDEHQFVTKKDYEADDLCIITHNLIKQRGEYNPIIASPDKDLRQIQGVFYDYKKKEITEINEEIAHKNLWKQVLTGDAGDNIQGIPGIGDKKAEYILLDRENENYSTIVLNAYTAYYGEYKGILAFTENYQLVKMLKDDYLLDINLIEIKKDLDEWLK